MSENNKVRFYGFDYVRVLMLFFVILLHTIETILYIGMAGVSINDPFVKTCAEILFIFLDPSVMCIFFFLAGYFAPPSLVKRGRYTFINQKVSRILLPCILGIFLVVLPFRYTTFKAALNLNSIIDFTTKYFFGSLYS